MDGGFNCEIWSSGLSNQRAARPDNECDEPEVVMAKEEKDKERERKRSVSSNLNLTGTGSGHSVLYRIFHPFDEGAVFHGRSKRYSSDSEYSEFENSDAESVDSPYASLGRNGAQGSMPRLASISNFGSLFRQHKSSSTADSDSEAESDSSHAAAPSFRKMSFKNILNSRRGSNVPIPHSQPVASSSKSKSETEDSGSSDQEFHHGSNFQQERHNSIFKNIMRRTTGSSAPSLQLQLPPEKQVTHSPSTSLIPLASSGEATPRPSDETVKPLQRTASEVSLGEKYGVDHGAKKKELGKGATAVVRLCSPVNSDKKYAIKEFKSRKKGTPQKEYIKGVTSEFCIASSLIHEHVVRTVDLIQDEKKRWCLVMEFSEGGDLFSIIKDGRLSDAGPDVTDCLFRQLCDGVAYLHGQGVAHRDLKPENLLLDASCRNLRISDFGVSAVFHLPLETGTKKSSGECGSGPYMAPEVFLGKEYEPDLVDVWAVAIIYYVMVYNSIPWMVGKLSDQRFKYYTEHHGNFGPIDRLVSFKRKLLYQMLTPSPSARISIKEVLRSEWVESIEMCKVGMPAEAVQHSHASLKAQGS